MSINSRNSYNIRKIKKFNNIDQTYNNEDLKNIVIKPQKIEKANINLSSLIDNKKQECERELKDSLSKRINEPYKGIIKNFDYKKKIKESDDLIIHKVSVEDKDKNVFDKKMGNFKDEIKVQDTDFKTIYSIDKKTEHKKEFDYQHKYKYRAKIEDDGEDNLRVDRIEFYKKEQTKIEDSKKKIDDILLNLIDSGILSDNLESINYDKIDASELEEKLKSAFGNEEFDKLMKELSN
jgi:hypothetical protein